MPGETIDREPSGFGEPRRGVTEALDGVLRALSNPRRRVALYYLADRRRVGVLELARHVAAWERTLPPDGVPPADARRAYLEFVRTHLPLLTECGLVEYDVEDGTVEYVARGTSERCLRSVRDLEAETLPEWLAQR
ncbi:MAG: hypothetical protein ABEJ89_08765 [Haloarculaceae archaeon]